MSRIEREDVEILRDKIIAASDWESHPVNVDEKMLKAINDFMEAATCPKGDEDCFCRVFGMIGGMVANLKAEGLSADFISSEVNKVTAFIGNALVKINN